MYSDLWNLYSLITRSNYEQIWYFSCVVSRLAKNNFVMMIYRAAVHQPATVSAGCTCTCIKQWQWGWRRPVLGQAHQQLASSSHTLLPLVSSCCPSRPGPSYNSSSLSWTALCQQVKPASIYLALQGSFSSHHIGDAEFKKLLLLKLNEDFVWGSLTVLRPAKQLNSVCLVYTLNFLVLSETGGHVGPFI